MIETGNSKPERLFIGVPFSEDARAAVSRLLPKNLPGKIVTPDKWHFTLRFLGATNPDARDAVISGLSSTKLGAPFKIRFGELGAFPNTRRARVLWLGVPRGGEQLSALAAVAESVARAAGFRAEGRRFTPHLTLSRLDPPQSVAALVENGRDLGVEMRVESVILYRSCLGGGPARYEEAQRFVLSQS
jgi:RNA 2',3'-cyclic 3'-phosphodiesterase